MRASAMAISSCSNLCSGLVSALPARGPVFEATFGVVAATLGLVGATLGVVNATLGIVDATLGVVVATLATRAMSASPFQFVDGACQLSCLGFETRYPLRVLTTFGLGKLADYPTVQALHVVQADPFRQLHSHFVVHTRRRRRPRSSNQVLFLWGISRQLRLEPGHTAALVCLQHPHVYTAILFV